MGTQDRNRWLRSAIALCSLFSLTAVCHGSSFTRMGLEELHLTNETIVIAEALDSYSYWNDAGSLIFTNVRLQVVETVKGSVDNEQFMVSLMGGSVGELTTLILGTAKLVPGHSYLLFLNSGFLAGSEVGRTVRDHCQGVFDIVNTDDGLRALSQARFQVMHPDGEGIAIAPGGEAGIPLEDLVAQLRTMSDEVMP